MKKTLLALSLFAITPAFAQTAGHSYLALDLGSASYSGVTVAAGTYPNPGTFSVAYGYRTSERLAVELGATVFGDSILSSSTITATASASSLNAKLVGTLPLNEQFGLIGNVGVGFNKNQLSITSSPTMSGSATSLIYGVGVKYTINQRFALRALYENYGSFGDFGATGSPMTVTTFTIGGDINF